MTNELIQLMDENLFTGTEIKKNYEALALRDPAKNIGDYSKAVDERILQYMSEYGDIYKDDVIKSDIQNILEEEERRLNQIMDEEDKELNAKREFIIEKATKEIAASEDLTTDEINKRVYHSNLMANDLIMKLSNVTELLEMRTLLNEQLKAAKRDEQKAHALKTNMHLFMTKTKELEEFEQAQAKSAVYLANDMIDDIVTPNRIKVYKVLNEEMKQYGETSNNAARLTMKMAKNKYKQKYGLGL